MNRARAGREIAIEKLDWTRLVPAGALVVWGQASAEPTSLTASLMAQRAAIGGFRAFVGISYGSSVSLRHCDHVGFSSYCGSGNNRTLGAALDVLPIPYSALAQTLVREAPIVMLSLGPGSDDHHFSFGAGRDYLADMVQGASLVIAEVNERNPRSGDRTQEIARSDIDIVVCTQDTPPSGPPARSGETEKRIAELVADLIEDGSTLQIGLGGIPAAVVAALGRHRDLGVHSGLIGDGIVDLAERGVLTNTRKSVDRGVTVTGLLADSRRLLSWADRNIALALRPTSYTHDPAVLASLDRLVALNSAIEVDLTGQINAEVAGGRYVGAVGGAGAFLRGAHQSRGGLPIIALPSIAAGRSSIVAALSGPVSTARADAGVFVTEHGIADLRGLSIRARRQAMLAIASPEHVAQIENEIGNRSAPE